MLVWWKPHAILVNPAAFCRLRVRERGESAFCAACAFSHALRDQNAYYSPSKRACCGYFPCCRRTRTIRLGRTRMFCMPVRTTSSHTRRRTRCSTRVTSNSTNPAIPTFTPSMKDADIVAMLQHFSYAGVLRDQIGRTRSHLNDEEPLGQLAHVSVAPPDAAAPCGTRSGRGSDGIWRRRQPDTVVPLTKTTELHARGAILDGGGVRRIPAGLQAPHLRSLSSRDAGHRRPSRGRDLARSGQPAGGGGIAVCPRHSANAHPRAGLLPAGPGSRSATIGAIITGDVNLNADDDLGYRVALVESFRAWGIYPRGIRSMSIEGLVWPSGAEVIAETQAMRGKRKQELQSAPSPLAVRTAREDSERRHRGPVQCQARRRRRAPSARILTLPDNSCAPIYATPGTPVADSAVMWRNRPVIRRSFQRSVTRTAYQLTSSARRWTPPTPVCDGDQQA